ncbi:hypothetical protein XPA_006980 [Xanthoria parietina]
MADNCNESAASKFYRHRRELSQVHGNMIDNWADRGVSSKTTLTTQPSTVQTIIHHEQKWVLDAPAAVVALAPAQPASAPANVPSPYPARASHPIRRDKDLQSASLTVGQSRTHQQYNTSGGWPACRIWPCSSGGWVCLLPWGC